MHVYARLRFAGWTPTGGWHCLAISKFAASWTGTGLWVAFCCQSQILRQAQRVHSSVVRAADCRSAGPWFKSGCALQANLQRLCLKKLFNNFLQVSCYMINVKFNQNPNWIYLSTAVQMDDWIAPRALHVVLLCTSVAILCSALMFLIKRENAQNAQTTRFSFSTLAEQCGYSTLAEH